MADEKLQEKIRQLYKKYPVNPDKELLEWEKWVTIRKEEISHLSKSLKRPPVDLTMNLLEKVRADLEDKTVLENAQIKRTIFIRGGPWGLKALRLKQRSENEPVYEGHVTKTQYGRPPVIEHIGVPHYIQVKEKGLSGEPTRNPCTTLEADYIKYKQEREMKLKNKIKRINPYNPDIDKLVIIGEKKCLLPKLPERPIPDIVIKQPFIPHATPLMEVFALRINNSVFFKSVPYYTLTHLRKLQNEKWHENCNSWTYYFNISTGNVGRSVIFLQNLGTVTLRFCWKKLKRSLQYIPDLIEEQVFFFNKNEDLISPGQYKKIKISFVSKKTGTFKEFWQFYLCNITSFDSPETCRFTINLYGDAIENVDKKTGHIDTLMHKIDRRAVHKMAVDLLNDLIDQATAMQTYISKYEKFFLEADLFVLKNPICYYHQTEVKRLKDKYMEINPSHSQWDLSIESWRDAMIKLSFNDRMLNYEFLKNSHRILLKPWLEGDEISFEKFKSVKIFLGQLMDLFYDEYVRICKAYEYLDDRRVTYPDFSPKGSTLVVRSNNPRPVTTLHELTVKNIFYLVMYEHVARTVEICAGVLSSIDLNRWLEFDFCQM